MITFIAFSIYCFFYDHDTWLLLLEYFVWFVQVSTVFEKFFKCYFAVSISLTRKLRKKTHILQTVFLWIIMGKSFLLNHLVLHFNSRINRGFYFCKQFLSEEIPRILLCKNVFCKNVYRPKYIFHKNLFV